MCKLSIFVVVVAMVCCSIAGPVPQHMPGFGYGFGSNPFFTNFVTGFDKLGSGAAGMTSSSVSSMSGSGGKHHSVVMTSHKEPGKKPVIVVAKDIDGKVTYYSNKQ